MSDPKIAEKCKRCDVEAGGPYCANCGAPQSIPRINGQFILMELARVFNFQKGIFYTIRELLLRPGKSVNHFIHEDRSSLFKPINFVILCSVIYIVFQRYFRFEDGYVNYSELGWGDSAVTTIMTWVSNNYGLANVVMAFFIALWIRVFFRKYTYNYFEILILLYFIMGIGMLMFAFLGLIEALAQVPILNNGSLLAFLYIGWAIGQFFDGKRFMNYIKAFLSYLLGMITFTIVAIILGKSIDWMMG